MKQITRDRLAKHVKHYSVETLKKKLFNTRDQLAIKIIMDELRTR